jgi:hypothetical protein
MGADSCGGCPLGRVAYRERYDTWIMTSGREQDQIEVSLLLLLFLLYFCCHTLMQVYVEVNPQVTEGLLHCRFLNLNWRS